MGVPVGKSWGAAPLDAATRELFERRGWWAASQALTSMGHVVVVLDPESPLPLVHVGAGEGLLIVVHAPGPGWDLRVSGNGH